MALTSFAITPHAMSRRDSVVITRLRIGHTRLTHSYLLFKENRLECLYCHVTLTVKHFLVECPFLSMERSVYFSATSLKKFFEHVDSSAIINFIKDIHFYDRT